MSTGTEKRMGENNYNKKWNIRSGGQGDLIGQFLVLWAFFQRYRALFQWSWALFSVVFGAFPMVLGISSIVSGTFLMVLPALFLGT